MTERNFTMSNINMACDFCGAALDDVYHATPSPRGMVVCVCSGCGLVQSRQTGSPPTETIRTTSSEADWGNIRHGKGARLQPSLKILQAHAVFDSVTRVLDIGSNRGHFVQWLHATHPQIACVAVEPDGSVVSNYATQPGLTLHLSRFEAMQFAPGSFDLIYSSHSLEHADSAAAMMRHSYEILAEGGWLYLEVPNLQAIGERDIVEEFFIDKHSFHFDPVTLGAFCESLGFEQVNPAQDTDAFNLCLLLRKSGTPKPFVGAPTHAAPQRALIDGYRQTLAANRQMLHSVVTRYLAPLAARQKVGYWGAGRIFDALVKFGGLDPRQIHCLVDAHLAGIVPQVHGVPIQPPRALKRAEPQVVVVLGRSSEQEMARQAQAFGIRHVLKFSDLLAQCR